MLQDLDRLVDQFGSTIGSVIPGAVIRHSTGRWAISEAISRADFAEWVKATRCVRAQMEDELEGLGRFPMAEAVREQLGGEG